QRNPAGWVNRVQGPVIATEGNPCYWLPHKVMALRAEIGCIHCPYALNAREVQGLLIGRERCTVKECACSRVAADTGIPGIKMGGMLDFIIENVLEISGIHTDAVNYTDGTVGRIERTTVGGEGKCIVMQEIDRFSYG